MSQDGEPSSSSFTRPSVPSTSAVQLPENQQDIINKCTSIVQDFQAGQISKPKASILLQQSIPRDESSEDQFLSTYEPYFDMLDNFECYQKGNVGRIDGVHQRITESLPDEQDNANSQPTSDAVLVRPSKQPRSPLSEDEDNEYEKRTHLDFSLLPWNELEESNLDSMSKLSPSLQKTHALLENFSQDVKRMQSSLLNCNRSIPQFPQAEWLNLLSGNSVDLDHVFSNIYTVSYNTKDIVKLGRNIELLHGLSTPAKMVKTHGDWVITWDCVKLGVRTETSGPKSCEALASTCRLRRSLAGCLEFRRSGQSRRVRSRAEK